MATEPLGSVLDYLRRVVGTRGEDDATDAQLLGRFLRARDEEAFAQLVQRHARLVLGVCQRVLHDPHDAEDAFQATFLVLARRAASIRKQASLGSWLYGVAYRTAQRNRVEAARRQAQERQAAEMPYLESGTGAAWRDLRPVLDAELDRLPEKYRAPLVLCYLEGKTNEEAARLLGWSKGTISGRLARARELLRGRLARRGLALPAATLATLLLHNAASAAVPASLLASTVKAASLVVVGQTAAAAGVSIHVAALAEGVVQSMIMTKLKITTAVFFTLAALVAGAGALSHGSFAAGTDGTTGVTAVPGVSAPGGKDQKQEQDPDKLRKELEALRLELEKTKQALREAQLQLERAKLEELRARAQAEAERARALAELARAMKMRENAEVEAMRLKQLADRARVATNLKAIAKAMHQYHDLHDTLPTAAIYSKDGKPLLSWRVALLPMLGHEKLYLQFRLDEPWDSPHNKKLIDQTPDVFAPVRAGAGPRHLTAYQVFTGKDTLFEGMRGIRLQDVADGTVCTILVVEAHNEVPWTRPEDISYDPSKALPKFGAVPKDGFHVLMADGSVRFVVATVEEQLLRAAITRNGGEVLDPDRLGR
jgi:RNA polymerase sigma factor (sigma-70 family)